MGYFVRIYIILIIWYDNILPNYRVTKYHRGRSLKQASKTDVYAIGWHSSHFHKTKDNKRMSEGNRK